MYNLRPGVVLYYDELIVRYRPEGRENKSEPFCPELVVFA